MKYVAVTIILLVLIGGVAGWLLGSRTVKSQSPFRLPIDDAFAITERGKVVVVGVVAQGEIRPGARLLLQAESRRLPVTVEALEAYHQPLQVARQGDRVGIMLVGAEKDQISAGAILISNTE